MECLTASGKIVEYIVKPVGRQVGYIIYYNKNLKNLQNQVRDLDAARETMERKIIEEKRNGREVETLVNYWLTDVNKITEEAKEFLKDEHQAKIKCLLHGFCPNLLHRHQLSRKSTKLVQGVAKLYGKKDFINIAYDVTPEEVCVLSTQDYQVYDSRTAVMKNIMDELRNSNTDMIGVYGIGGVGKTTLVKEIYKQVKKDEKLFDEVVMVLDLKQNPSIERIQKEIAEKLGLNFHEIETPAGRARCLCNRMKGKNTLVLLDDVWENIDLEAVGLPCLPTLKILLTSRSKIAFSRHMDTKKDFHLDVLDEKETWSLFQTMVGDIVKKLDIQTVATQVAEKCGGLPLLIVTVARALKNSQLQGLWKDALRQLKRLDGQGLTEKVYSTIEWSYNKLDSEELKSLFLLCGIAFETGNTFSTVDLWKYSMGLGLLKNVDTIEEAKEAFNSLLQQLKDSCLLLDTDDNTSVRMHDLVKDVAKGIASKDQPMLSLSYGNELKEWPDKEFREKCTKICLDHCNIPKFPDVLQCPELTLFCLVSKNDDSSREIPCNFFKEMKKLKLLDLTNRKMSSLPSSLPFLTNLRTLCLDGCTLGDIALVGQLQNLEFLSFLGSTFKQLPKEIGQLTRLRMLDLSHCSQLEVISPNVLSSLKSLEDLRMGNSFNRWEVGRVINTERSNANLQELKYLHQLTSLQIHIPDANTLPADLFTSKLERFQICIGSAWKWDDVDEAHNALKLQLTTSNKLDHGLKMLLKKTKDLYLEGINNSIFYQLGLEGFQKLKHLHVQNNDEFTYIINGKVSFPYLTWLAVSELNSLRFLLSSSMVRNLAQLKRLQISGCQIMEEIISIKGDEEIAGNMFCQLQHLELKDLPNLTKFCSRSHNELPNPSLEILQLENSSKQDNFLFDNKVQFQNLKKLSIDRLKLLTTIWHDQLAEESSKNLESIEVDSCESLKHIFSASRARGLQQLRELKVRKCGVEEIIANEEGQQTTLKFVFSKVTVVVFEDLPQLRSFYPVVHVSSWPALRELEVVRCNKLEIFAEELSSFQRKHESNRLSTPTKQTLFLIEEDSFPNLEDLCLCRMEIWNGPLPVKFFSKLKYLTVCCPESKSVVFLEKLLDEVNCKNSAGEIHAVEFGSLPHLRNLHLRKMPNLINLGEENSQSAGTNFPELDILCLAYCHSLRNLRSSAISFKNLTSLQISCCKGLKYLITYSMARSLMQLTKLEVEECPRLVEIVGSNEEDEDDSGDEITFGWLRHLKLSLLPRLRGFCSGNCIVKFPSLETLSISNRLKLKIFQTIGDETLQTTNEKEDTDVDEWEAGLTAEDEKTRQAPI